LKVKWKRTNGSPTTSRNGLSVERKAERKGNGR
jgi:hypothetical protein